jgi:hypothetical protein
MDSGGTTALKERLLRGQACAVASPYCHYKNFFKYCNFS